MPKSSLFTIIRKCVVILYYIILFEKLIFQHFIRVYYFFKFTFVRVTSHYTGFTLLRAKNRYNERRL